jgi:hypothetical protein
MASSSSGHVHAVSGRREGNATSLAIAGLMGPTLIAMGITEALNLRAMEEAQAPLGVVYLNGTLLFMAGVAVIRVHNRWGWSWPLLVTVTGWVSLVVGVARMVAPGGTTSGSAGVYALLLAMTVTGLVLTYEAYAPGAEAAQTGPGSEQ